MAVECPFAHKARFDKRIARQFAATHVPTKYKEKTWADYDVDADNENAVNHVKAILKTKDWMYLYGLPGTGKTLLAAIIANENLARARPVIFKDVPYLLNKLRSSFSKNNTNTLDDMLNTLKEIDLLFLDDWGVNF